MSNPIQPPGNYPSMSQVPMGAPAVQGPPPATVTNAVRAILVRVALKLVGIAVLLATQDSLRAQLLKAGPSLTPAALDTAVAVAVALTIASGIVGAVLWGLLAFFIRKGKNWARITMWVFAGLPVLSVPFTLAQGAAGLNLALSLINLALDVAIIVLLAQRPSSKFFRHPVANS